MTTKSRIFFVFICICCVLVIIPDIEIFSSFKPYLEYDKHVNRSLKREVKKILLWNPFFDIKTWGLPSSLVDSLFFEKDNCPQTNCIVTYNKTFLHSVTEFDAIMFHMSFAKKMSKHIPKERRANQIYMYVNNESPANTVFGCEIQRFFNWTLTYRFDSDMINYYGKVRDLETGEMIAPKMSPEWRPVADDFQLDKLTEGLIAGKMKMAAWFVSHCRVASRRDALAKKLQKYVNVDIYGKCGPLNCPPVIEEDEDDINHDEDRINEADF